MGNSSSLSSSKSSRLTVLSPIELPGGSTDDKKNANGGGGTEVDSPSSRQDAKRDALDEFNHPRERRMRILKSLQSKASKTNVDINYLQTKPKTLSSSSEEGEREGEIVMGVYKTVHSKELLQFLIQAWGKWESLGTQGRDPSGYLMSSVSKDTNDTNTDQQENDDTDEDSSYEKDDPPPPAFTLTNVPLPRVGGQRPSEHVLGQIGYYCTDTTTPIFLGLSNELIDDATIIQTALIQLQRQLRGEGGSDPAGTTTATTADAVAAAAAAAAATDTSTTIDNNNNLTMYLLPTHPGHHAARDSFGGYCYVNHAAALAQGIVMMDMKDEENEKVSDDKDNNKNGGGERGAEADGAQPPSPPSQQPASPNNNQRRKKKVAILDVDYHCGNGTASIFEDSTDVCVCSIHCDPNFDYPFHSGFSGQSTKNVQHLPLPPGTTWKKDYLPALKRGLDTIRHWNPDVVVISLGLDTYENDPVALMNAGFVMNGTDYSEMGGTIGHGLLGTHVPIVFVQEGGYKMDQVGDAAADVVLSCCKARAD